MIKELIEKLKAEMEREEKAREIHKDIQKQIDLFMKADNETDARAALNTIELMAYKATTI